MDASNVYDFINNDSIEIFLVAYDPKREVGAQILIICKDGRKFTAESFSPCKNGVQGEFMKIDG